MSRNAPRNMLSPAEDLPANSSAELDDAALPHCEGSSTIYARGFGYPRPVSAFAWLISPTSDPRTQAARLIRGF